MNAGIWVAPLAISACLSFALGCAFLVSAAFAVSVVKWPAKGVQHNTPVLEGAKLPIAQVGVSSGIPKVSIKSVRWVSLSCATSARGKGRVGHKFILHPSSGHARASEVLGLIGDLIRSAPGGRT